MATGDRASTGACEDRSIRAVRSESEGRVGVQERWRTHTCDEAAALPPLLLLHDRVPPNKLDAEGRRGSDASADDPVNKRVGPSEKHSSLFSHIQCEV